MAERGSVESLSHIASHLMREIESALRAVLGTLPDAAEADASAGQEGHRRSILRVLIALDIQEDHAVAKSWLGLAGSDNPYGLSARAHRDALARPRPVDNEFISLWDEFQAVLGYVLDRFEGRFLEPHAVLDELLALDAPSTDDLKRLRQQVPNNPITLGYFFDRLDKPAWLEPLHGAGFFAHPIDPIKEEGRIAFPFWPQSRFLARAAAEWPKKHAEILRIALEIPDADNVRVHEDIADVAVKLSPDLAVRLVPRLAARVQSPYHMVLPMKLGELVSHLAKGDQVDAALQLAQALLEIPQPEEEQARFGRDPRAWIDEWEYEQILEVNVPDLVAVAEIRALEALCDCLEQAIEADVQTEGREPPQDYSYIWRPAIEDHEQNHDRGIREALVKAIRNGAEALTQDGHKETVVAVVEFLRRRGWNIFKRLALQVLRMHPDAGRKLVAEALTKKEDFEGAEVWHEYALLLGEAFGRLSPQDQETILGWIDAGPELREGSEEATDEQVKYWKLAHLAPFVDSLPAGWRQRYDEWEAELGAPEHPDLAFYSGTWTGDPTPKSTAQLSSMPIEELVSFLQTWQPEESVLGSPREGLGISLNKAVSERPERFAAEANRFQGLDPTYVHAFFEGLRDAIKEKKAAFPWPAVLELAAWVLDQPREVPGRTGRYADLDPGWVWTRKAIADILNAAFNLGPTELPLNLREPAWKILEALAADPDPTSADEDQYGRSNMDPATSSLNTIRPRALHAVIGFALWVKRHEESEVEEEGATPWSFDRAAEVRDLLDAHVDPTSDSSLAVRGVYGWRLLQLFGLDTEWVQARLGDLFPDAQEFANLRQATWDSYVVFCGVNRALFDLLRGEYAAAVNRIRTDRLDDRFTSDPDDRLAAHVMTLYWHGAIQLDDPLLQAFFSRAPDEVRASALRFIGTSLRDAEATPDEDVLERLRLLWEARLPYARKDPETHRKEMAAFGWWVISAKLDDAWTLGQLREATVVGGDIDIANLVVRRLANLVAVAPAAVIESLEHMAQSDREGWKIYGWREDARTILSAVIAGGDSEARAAAVGLVHRLGARGFQEFRDLLPGA
jgi:hypothetical protein